MRDPSEYSKISWDEAQGGRVGPLPADHVFPSDVALTLKPYTIPLQTEYVALSLCHIAPGESSEMERTKVAEEVYYIAQGRIRFRIGKKDVEAKQHDAVRVPAHVVRALYNDSSEDCWLLVMAAPIDEFLEHYKKAGLM